MKKTFFIAIFAMFFVACSQVNSVMTLNPYIANGIKTATQKSVNIQTITDKRTNSNIIAKVKDNDGNVIEYVTLENNLVSWFDKALKAELEAKGINISQNSSNIANIDINKLEANIDGYSKQNLSGECEIFITVKEGKTTYSKRVAQNQSQFAAIRTGGAFSPFVENILIDVVRKTADQIISVL